MRSAGLFFVLFVSAGAACGRGGRPDWSHQVDLSPPPPQPSQPPRPFPEKPRAAGVLRDAAPVRCTRDASFPASFPVPEASAAAEIAVGAARELLVVSDSGGNGAAMAWPVPSGPPRALKLPLDGAASDDLEGMAWVRSAEGEGGALYVLTSSGAVRRFSPDGKGGMTRDQDAYAIGPPPFSCDDLHEFNCGKNYEGLCLRRRAAIEGAPCAGYAASKAESALYCVVLQNDRLAVDTERAPIALPLRKNALSDCAFGADGGPAEDTLLVTTNVFSGSQSFVADEKTGDLSPLDVASTLNNEAVAAGKDGAFYVFEDDNHAPSRGYRMTCDGWR